MEEGQEGLGEPGEVPLRHDGLVPVGVAPAVVDRAVDSGRVEGLQECARSVVDGLARDGHVVGVHDPVDEPHEHPSGYQRRLRGDHRLEERAVRVLGLCGVGIVAGDGVIGEAAQEVDVARGAGVLEAAHAQVAVRDPGEHGARQQGLAAYRPSRCHHGEGACRRYAKGVHRLADDVFAQHRADGSQSVAGAREGSAAGTFEVDVAEVPFGVGGLAQQECAPVA